MYIYIYIVMKTVESYNSLVEKIKNV